MANRYEIKAEDINRVTIRDITSDSNYSVFYNRKLDENGTPTREFVVIYEADPDIDGENIKCICKRCERWNTFNYEDWKKPGFNENQCEYCSEDYETIVTENELIDLVLSYMDEDLFFDVDLYINDVLIR